MRRIWKTEKTVRAAQEQNAPKAPAECLSWKKKKELLENLQKGEEATFGHSFKTTAIQKLIPNFKNSISEKYEREKIKKLFKPRTNDAQLNYNNTFHYRKNRS